MTAIFQYLIIGLALGSLYGLIAVGFTIVYNASSIVNFAHGELVMIGGMLTIALVDAGVPVVLAAMSAILGAAVAAGAIQVATLDRFPRPDPVRVILATLAVGLVFKAGALRIWGKDPHYLKPFSSKDRVVLGDVTAPTQALWVIGVTAVVVALLWLFYRQTRVGQGMIAASIDRSTAGLMGVDVRRVALGAFALSGVIGAIAGIVTAPLTTSSYSIGTPLAVKGFVAAAIGGIGNPFGALVGGVIVGLSETFATGYVSSELKDTIALGLGVLLLLMRPQGLLKGSAR
ncbi:MAG: branched-chain amino acid ABC transporter permease [Acidimicrobiia bacterium]